MAGMTSPVQGYISSHYGYRNGTLHAGTDIAGGGVSRPVYAAYAGTLSNIVRGRARWQSPTVGPVVAPYRSGDGARVKNPDGEQQLYIHVAILPGLKNGDKVKQGQLIGHTNLSGNTTGYHLHFEVWNKAGRTRNPLIDFRAHGITPGSKPVGTSTGKPSKPSNPDVPVKGSLREGDSGPDVEALQRALNKWKTDLPLLVVDGKYQSKTVARVKEWQERNRGGVYPAGYAIDGIAGQYTLRPLGVTLTGGGSSASKPKPKPGPSGPSAKVKARLKRMGLPQTVAGVRTYQRNQGLVADGDWGSVTERWFQWVEALQTKLNEWKAVQRLGRLLVDGYRAGKTIRAEDAVIALPGNRKVLGIRNTGTKVQKRADLYKGLGIGPVPPKKG